MSYALRNIAGRGYPEWRRRNRLRPSRAEHRLAAGGASSSSSRVPARSKQNSTVRSRWRAASSITLVDIGRPGVPPNIDAAWHLSLRGLSYSLRTAQRHSTLSASVWMKQELSPRCLAGRTSQGMGFQRSTFERIRFEILPLPPGITIPNIFPTVVEDGHLRRAATRRDRGPHRADRAHRPRARIASPRPRQRLVATPGRRPGVEFLTARLYSQVALTGEMPRTFNPSRPPSPISVARTDIR